MKCACGNDAKQFSTICYECLYQALKDVEKPLTVERLGGCRECGDDCTENMSLREVPK